MIKVVEVVRPTCCTVAASVHGGIEWEDGLWMMRRPGQQTPEPGGVWLEVVACPWCGERLPPTVSAANHMHVYGAPRGPNCTICGEPDPSAVPPVKDGSEPPDELAARRALKESGGGYEMVLAFDTDDPQFTRGVEVGILHTRLSAKPNALQGTYHVTNSEMLRRVAEANGYDVAIEDVGDGFWAFATFTRRAR